MLGHFRRRFRAYASRIGVRLITVYLVLLVVPVMIISVYGYLFLERNLQRHLIADMQHQATSQAYAVDMALGHIHDDILYLEQHISNATQVRSDAAYVELDGFAQTHNLYRHIALILSDGRLAAGTLPDNLLTWVGSAEFATISEMAFGTIRFITMYDVAPSNTTPENLTNEALLIAIVQLPFGKLLLNMDTNYFMSGITAHEEDVIWVGEWALLLQDNVLMTSAQTLHLGQITRQDFVEDAGYFALPSQNKTVFYQKTGPAHNWLLLYVVDDAILIPDTYHYLVTISVLLIGGITSVVGLALLAIIHLTEPIRHLERMVDALRDGRRLPDVPASPVSSNEFHKLMVTFDQMADELDVRQKNERALIEQLIHAQEEERKRIAYDLHDGMIQGLVGARFYIGEAKETYASSEHPAENPMTGAYDIITRSIAEGRRIMQGLHPTVLEDLGLSAALRELCKLSGDKEGWMMTCEIEDVSCDADRSVSVTLYRIAQEALSNICRHAGARCVTIRLTEQEHQIALHIIDDGLGFDPHQVNVIGGNHWGIRTMQERAQMLDGVCHITSMQGAGTHVHVCIPIQNERVAL